MKLIWVIERSTYIIFTYWSLAAQGWVGSIVVNLMGSACGMYMDLRIPNLKGAAKAEVTRTQQLISMLCNVFFVFWIASLRWQVGL